MTLPDDCLQAIVDPFWVQDDGKGLCRGRLIWAYLPLVRAESATLEVEAKSDATDHGKARYSIRSPLSMDGDRTVAKVPVAALPQTGGEVYLVQSAWLRPALVLRTEPHAPTMLVAPLYETRAGAPATLDPEFLTRARRCEYPESLCLWLPGQGEPSIARLDQVQPVGVFAQNYQLTKSRMSPDALQCLDDWMNWLFTGALPPGVLDDIRTGLMEA